MVTKETDRPRSLPNRVFGPALLPVPRPNQSRVAGPMRFDDASREAPDHGHGETSGREGDAIPERADRGALEPRARGIVGRFEDGEGVPVDVANPRRKEDAPDRQQ